MNYLKLSKATILAPQKLTKGFQQMEKHLFMKNTALQTGRTEICGMLAWGGSL